MLILEIQALFIGLMFIGIILINNMMEKMHIIMQQVEQILCIQLKKKLVHMIQLA